MAGAAIVEAGVYDLQIDTGFVQDAFILDANPQGLLNNTTYVLDGTTNFASVIDNTLSINAQRGRRDVGDQFSAGTMSFVLNDTAANGVFNPFDTLSPYYDPATAQPGLAPMRKVKLSRYSATNVEEILFSGFIVNYDYNFELGGLDTVTVYCADQFYLLAQTYMDEFNVSEQLSSDRVTAVLDLPEVAYPSGPTHRDIQTGTQTLGGAAAFTIPLGTNVKSYFDQIQQAEQGRIFMSRAGVLTFEPRIGNTLSASVADFHDDGTNIPYAGVGITFEADQVVNRATVTILGSNNEQTANDLASQAKYFIQTASITGSLLHNNTAALDLATYLIEGEPEARYTSVTTNLAMLTTAQRDTVAVIDIGQTITIEKTFQSGSGTSELAQELSVEGIQHQINVGQSHTITLFTAPTTIVYEFILNDAVFGILGITDPQPVLG
jgi:hypothetical protein